MMKKLPLLLALCICASSAWALSATSASTTNLAPVGRIAHLGDSITEMEGCYRISLWKCFVDNDVPFNPTGTSRKPSQLTYRGQTFPNIYDGHSSWRTDHLLEGKKNTPGLGGEGQLSDWIASMKKSATLPDTMTLLIGINDLSWARGEAPEPPQMLANIGKIIKQYKLANPKVNIHLFSVLDSDQAWQHDPNRTNSTAYNKMLKAKIEAGSYGSSVFFHDITPGFTPIKGITADDMGVHPTEQGALIVAGNMAKALGIGSRTVGLSRRETTQLATQVTFTKGKSKQTMTANHIQSSSNQWIYPSPKTATLATLGKDASLSATWSPTPTGEFSLNLTLLLKKTSTETNTFCIQVGNGMTENGIITLTPDKLTWGDDKGTLYSGELTQKPLNLRIVYRSADNANGLKAGYYIWVNDVLVGDAKSGTLTAKSAGFRIGSINASTPCNASVTQIAYDDKAAFSPGKKY
ncbi:MAG: SGNH/GDSL hydrolase family protein [Akkermansia sp.]